MTELPKELTYAIRFPNELRAFSEHLILKTWLTDRIHPSSSIPRLTQSFVGGNPCYVCEGFLSIQTATALAFVQSNKKIPESTLPMLCGQRLPVPPYIDLFIGFKFWIPLSFAFIFVNNIYVIVAEKEKQLNDAMKIMGLSSLLQWMSWFIWTMIILSISISLIVFLLSVSSFRNKKKHEIKILKRKMMILHTVAHISTLQFIYFMDHIFQLRSLDYHIWFFR